MSNCKTVASKNVKNLCVKFHKNVPDIAKLFESLQKH